MKKALAFLGAALLLGSQPAAAYNDYIAPGAFWDPWIFRGTLHFSKGSISLTCNAEVTIVAPTNDSNDTWPPFDHSDVHGLVAEIQLSGGFLGLCSSIIFDPVGPGNISFPYGQELLFEDVFVTTINPGNCQGALFGSWEEGTIPQSWVITSGLSGVSGDACFISGTLFLNQPSSGNAVIDGDPDYNPGHP